jgi:hypothetical protein
MSISVSVSHAVVTEHSKEKQTIRMKAAGRASLLLKPFLLEYMHVGGGAAAAAAALVN